MQPFSGILQYRCPEKIRIFQEKTLVLESLFNKVSRNKQIPAQVFSCEFCEAFTNTFFTEHLRWSWSLSFKKFYIAGVHKKVFEWLAANEFLSNSKNYLHFSCIFITNEVVEHLSMKEDPFNQIIRKWPAKGVFVDFFEKYLGMNAGL